MVPCFVRQGWRQLEPNFLRKGVLYASMEGMPLIREAGNRCADTHLVSARFKFIRPQRQSGEPMKISLLEGSPPKILFNIRRKSGYHLKSYLFFKGPKLLTPFSTEVWRGEGTPGMED